MKFKNYILLGLMSLSITTVTNTAQNRWNRFKDVLFGMSVPCTLAGSYLGYINRELISNKITDICTPVINGGSSVINNGSSVVTKACSIDPYKLSTAALGFTTFYYAILYYMKKKELETFKDGVEAGNTATTRHR